MLLTSFPLRQEQKESVPPTANGTKTAAGRANKVTVITGLQLYIISSCPFSLASLLLTPPSHSPAYHLPGLSFACLSSSFLRLQPKLFHWLLSLSFSDPPSPPPSPPIYSSLLSPLRQDQQENVQPSAERTVAEGGEEPTKKKVCIPP